jgi:putative ABC transport system substrate-binding protein
VLVNPNNTSTKNSVQAIEVAARSLKLELQQFDVRSVEDVEGAFSLMTEKHIEAIVVVDDAVLNINVKKIAELAAKKRLPSIGITELVLAGGLISYGMDLPEMYRRSAFFIDKILKGAKPGDIPIERPTIFELIVNQKTAKALGIKFPQTIMVQATKVIE